MYNFILNLVTPFIKLVGKLYAPFSRKKISGKHYYEWRDNITIGTVLLTKTRGELSNLINPTKLKHAGIYVGEINYDGICYVAEATGKGVVLTDLVTFLTTKDIVVGCAPTFIRPDGMFEKTLQNITLRFVGTPYDYLFSKGDKALYCFELAATSLKSVYPELQLKCKEIIKGKRIYDGNTFLDDDFFTIKFDSRSE